VFTSQFCSSKTPDNIYNYFHETNATPWEDDDGNNNNNNDAVTMTFRFMQSRVEV
jgi:hypothetical protein